MRRGGSWLTFAVFANRIGVHSVDDVTDHLGRQSEILSNGVVSLLNA